MWFAYDAQESYLGYMYFLYLNKLNKIVFSKEEYC